MSLVFPSAANISSDPLSTSCVCGSYIGLSHGCAHCGVHLASRDNFRTCESVDDCAICSRFVRSTNRRLLSSTIADIQRAEVRRRKRASENILSVSLSSSSQPTRKLRAREARRIRLLELSQKSTRSSSLSSPLSPVINPMDADLQVFLDSLTPFSEFHATPPQPRQQPSESMLRLFEISRRSQLESMDAIPDEIITNRIEPLLSPPAEALATIVRGCINSVETCPNLHDFVVINPSTVPQQSDLVTRDDDPLHQRRVDQLISTSASLVSPESHQQTPSVIQADFGHFIKRVNVSVIETPSFAPSSNSGGDVNVNETIDVIAIEAANNHRHFVNWFEAPNDVPEKVLSSYGTKTTAPPNPCLSKAISTANQLAIHPLPTPVESATASCASTGASSSTNVKYSCNLDPSFLQPVDDSAPSITTKKMKLFDSVWVPRRQRANFTIYANDGTDDYEEIPVPKNCVICVRELENLKFEKPLTTNLCPQAVNTKAYLTEFVCRNRWCQQSACRYHAWQSVEQFRGCGCLHYVSTATFPSYLSCPSKKRKELFHTPLHPLPPLPPVPPTLSFPAIPPVSASEEVAKVDEYVSTPDQLMNDVMALDFTTIHACSMASSMPMVPTAEEIRSRVSEVRKSIGITARGKPIQNVTFGNVSYCCY